MKKDAFHREIKKFILEQNLLTYGEKVVVGVSGGPDSIALLHLLWSLSEEFNLGLHVAHINCMIRGVEAVEDAHYVRGVAEKFDLPFTIDEVDLSKERGSSIQDVARRLRYKFLVKVAKSIDASKIAVAHHADDNAETILMHLLYGCGQNGVKGIPPKRRMNGVEVVRPLLKFSKNQIIDYLDEVNLKWRTDSTNLKPFYLRNKIRLELLPQILKYNPNFKENLERLSEIWQIDDQYISQIAQEELERVSKVDGESVVINLKEFSSLHPALRRRILRNAIKMVKGNLRAIKYQHIASAERLVREGAPHGKIDLPNEIKV
jgi:tRNA(Ile)-lysidine synthase